MTADAQTTPLAELQETVQRQAWTIELLEESIGTLELQLEDAGWTRIGLDGQQEFSRDGLRKISESSRLYAIKNPVINRAVLLEQIYVWALGVNVQARHKAVNAVVQSFLDDEKNRAELGHQGRMEKELELQTDGNLFFRFFVNKSTGRVRVRSVPFSEIAEVLTSPEDRKEPWYYKRVWTEQSFDPSTGLPRQRERAAYYPDWRYRPIRSARLARIGPHPVEWDTPVYHVKVGGFSDWRFGVSEVYAALDWARAYKEFLEDVATIMRALSRFAAKLTTPGGKSGVAAAKAKLGSTLAASTASYGEANPPPVTGSVFVAGAGADYQPYNLRGASIAPDDGRRFLLMAAAATGWPETFWGDADVGNHATAKTLDRPTELRIRNRQALWSDVLRSICSFVVFWAVKAISGPLRPLGRIVLDEEGEERIAWGLDPETGERINPTVDVSFPPVVEHDVTESVGAIVSAATLDGKALAGTMDLRAATRMLLVALGQDNVDELLEALHPQDGPPPTQVAAESAMVEAARDLRRRLEAMEKSAA